MTIEELRRDLAAAEERLKAHDMWPEQEHCCVQLTFDFRKPVEYHDDGICLHSSILRKMAEDGVVRIIETNAHGDGSIQVLIDKSAEKLKHLVRLPQYEICTVLGMSLREMEEAERKSNAELADLLLKMIYRCR